MTRLYEFTNGTTTLLINMEHVVSICQSSGDGVLISMLNGSTYNVNMSYELLKEFLEKQSGVFVTETKEKNYEDVPF